MLDDSTGKIYIFGGWGVSATGDSNMYLLDTNAWSWQRISTAGMNNNNNSNATDSNLSSSSSNTSTIVGAVVGSVAGAAIIAGLLLFCLWRRRRQQRKHQQERDTESEKSDDNPFYWVNGDRVQNSREMLDGGGGNRKRVSKAMTGSFSFRDSATYRRSEIGDTDRVMTGVLTELTSPVDTSSEQSFSNGPRDSAHTSKALLIPSSELRSAQVPNEILSQKPNEFSMPASRMAAQVKGAVPVNHYVPQSSASVSGTDAPLSSSMEVLRSIRTNNGSSMLNHAGSGGITTRDGVPVTHATHVGNSDDDNTTYNDSNSYRSPAGPIQYIPPASNQFSIATTATESANTNDGHRTNSAAVPLVHHQYPSSNISSVPIARPITPVTEENRSMPQRLSEFNQQQGSIYDSVSPLEMLAALSRFNGTDSSTTATNNEPDSATGKQGSSATATTSSVPSDSNDTTPDETENPISSIGLSKDQQARFAALEPFINMLPKRYQIILSDPPIIGPMNSVLFVQSEGTQAVIKSFGRREAWERECRTLIKLKSSHVVDLLEVLTIQDESRTPLPRRKDAGSSGDSTDFDYDIAPDDDQIKYATVMGRLSETLGSAIRKARSQPQSWTRRDIIDSVEGVINCLAWCHSKGKLTLLMFTLFFDLQATC